MKVLELFAGSRSIGNVAELLGMEVFSSDVKQYGSINYVCDILKFDLNKLPFKPDIIWASPPCTGFSVASLGHHWTGGKNAYIPATDTARLGIALAKKTLEIINHLKPKYYFIENPRGVLRKLDFMKLLKNKSYWLNGGIIFLILDILLIGFIILSPKFSTQLLSFCIVE